MFEAWIFPDFAGFIFRQIGLHCNMSIMGLSMVIYVILDVPRWVLFFLDKYVPIKLGPQPSAQRLKLRYIQGTTTLETNI